MLFIYLYTIACSLARIVKYIAFRLFVRADYERNQQSPWIQR
jgi:hypothetical protein